MMTALEHVFHFHVPVHSFPMLAHRFSGNLFIKALI
jgi:hypothetical protein